MNSASIDADCLWVFFWCCILPIISGQVSIFKVVQSAPLVSVSPNSAEMQFDYIAMFAILTY